MRSRFSMQPKKLNDGKPSKSTQRAQLTRLILKLEREEEILIRPEASLDRNPLPVIGAEYRHGTTSRRAIVYGVLSLSFVLSVFSLTWMRREFEPAEVPQWKPVFALAEVAREKGALYDAKGFYSQAGTFAAWRDDWAGLLAVACGLDKLEKKPARYSARESLLLRAMAAAEKKQSRAGITAVARAFALLGEQELASVALSRVRKNWAAEDSDPGDVALPDCWTDRPDNGIDLTGE